jgi:hypothetical protein
MCITSRPKRRLTPCPTEKLIIWLAGRKAVLYGPLGWCLKFLRVLKTVRLLVCKVFRHYNGFVIVSLACSWKKFNRTELGYFRINLEFSLSLLRVTIRTARAGCGDHGAIRLINTPIFISLTFQIYLLHLLHILHLLHHLCAVPFLRSQKL